MKGHRSTPARGRAAQVWLLGLMASLVGLHSGTAGAEDGAAPPNAASAAPKMGAPGGTAAGKTPTAAAKTSDTAPRVSVEQYTLPNGLTVLLSRDKSLPVVATEMLYLVGSGHEREGRTGFAHLFEHLMFQGSKNHDREYFEPFEPIGGSVNGTTNQDRTNYFQRVPSNYLELPIWMESDRMRSLLPALSQGKLDNQRDVVKNERRQRYEVEPYGMAWWYLGEALYPKGHPYRHSPIGSHEDLTAATLDDVKEFFKQYYVPANAVFALVGDFEEAQAKDLIQRYFADIPGGERATAPNVPRPELASDVHWLKQDDVELPRIYLAWHSPALFEAGDAELDLWSSVLGDGKSSRLFQPLVYEQKVAKDVAAFQVSQKMSSYYVVTATAAPGVTIERLYAALDEALRKALQKPPTERELTRAKNAFKKDFFSRIEAASSRASLLASYYLHTGRADYISEDLARYVGASAEDVHTAARRFLTPGRHVRIDFVPGDRNLPLQVLSPQPPTGTPGQGRSIAPAQGAKSSPPAQGHSKTPAQGDQR
jgi:zinc protease